MTVAAGARPGRAPRCHSDSRGLCRPLLAETADRAGDADELREPVEKLVAVPRALAQQEQDGRLDEPLDARAHLPFARRDSPAGAGAAAVAVSPAVHDGQYR